MKKINVFYIWGYGGSPDSNTVKYLQGALGKDFNVVSDYYAQYSPKEAIIDLTTHINEKNIDLIVGSSLGAFLGLQLPNIPKVLINVCLHPEVELEKLTTDAENPKTHKIETVPAVPEHIINFYKEYCNSAYIWDNFNSKDTIFILGNNDELLGDKYWEEIRNHTHNIIISEQGHHNTKESIKNYVVPQIKKMFNK